VSLANDDLQLRGTKVQVKLALVRAIAKRAAGATEVEHCQALLDLARAFVFIPVPGELPDFVDSSGAPMTPATVPPAGGGGGGGGGHGHGAPAPSAHGGAHASAPGVPPLPSALEDRLDEIMEEPDADDPAKPAPAPAPAPAPTPITPEQIKLEDELEEARIALVDALAEAARRPIEHSGCIVRLAEALNVLPRPKVAGMGGHAHAPGHSHGAPPAPAPPPPPRPAPSPAPGHSHGL